MPSTVAGPIVRRLPRARCRRPCWPAAVACALGPVLGGPGAAAGEIGPGRYLCTAADRVGIEATGEARGAGRIEPPSEEAAFVLAVERLDDADKAVACYVGLPWPTGEACGNPDQAVWRLTLPTRPALHPAGRPLHVAAAADEAGAPVFWTGGLAWLRLSPAEPGRIDYLMTWPDDEDALFAGEPVSLYLEVGSCEAAAG